MRVAIHQPNFFPWLGFFHKISLVDKFVFFDHVQAMRGKNWYSRSNILEKGEKTWLSMPIKRSGKGFQRIDEVEINYEVAFEKKHLGRLSQIYSKCAYFEEVFPIVKKLYSKKHKFISDFNKEFITQTADKLNLAAKFLSSSQLAESFDELNSMQGNDLVLNTCIKTGAKTYVSGSGCLDFIDPISFENSGIKFIFQEFEIQEYPQLGNTGAFVSRLSILDALFNLGYAEVSKLLFNDSDLVCSAGSHR